MAKYDWIKLEREFTTLKKYATTSLREFAELKKIPYGINYRNHTKGWLNIRVAKQTAKSRKIEQSITEQEIADAQEFNRRHLNLYSKALDAAELILNEQMSKSEDMFGKVHDTGIYSAPKLKSVVQALDIAQKGQRLCLGMDKDFNPQASADEAAIDSILIQLRSRTPPKVIIDD